MKRKNLKLLFYVYGKSMARTQRLSTGSSRPPTGFDQKAFVEAMGTAFTTIAQASAASGQGGPSDLQRFRAHHPLTFRGGGDLVVADHWFR